MDKRSFTQSYIQFKHRAREHQVCFREQELGVGYCVYPNVLSKEDAKRGLVFCPIFRDEILEHLRQPIPPTSSKPSGQMLTNLLRSEHIPYNIFFPMQKDLTGCRDMFNAILGRYEIAKIRKIYIEYHPEPIDDYLGDHTAFDVYISYFDSDNHPCGIGIEVKYTEKEYPLKPHTREYRHVKDEQGNTRLYPPYLKATIDSQYYRNEISHDMLISNTFRQIWRNHILGASMVTKRKIRKFTSITLYPEANVHFSAIAMPRYQAMLSTKGQETFKALTYEKLFDLMDCYLSIERADEWIGYLKRRYLF